MDVLVTNIFIKKWSCNFQKKVSLVMFEPKGCNVSILVRFRSEGCSGLSRQAGMFLFEPFGCTMLHLKSLKGLYILYKITENK